MDLLGIGIFLALSLGAGYALAIGGLSLGLLSFSSGSILHTLLIALLMNLPALFAFLGGQLGRGGGPVLAGVLPAPRVAVLRVMVLMVVIFAAFNLVAAAIGFTALDWRMGTLINVLREMAGTMTQKEVVLSPAQLSVLPAFLLIAGVLLTVIFGATLFALCLLGQVYAWNVFLRDRLAPLGRLGAAGVGGLCWAVWMAPLAYGYVQATGVLEEAGAWRQLWFLPIGGVAVGIGLTAVLNAAYERSGSLVLPAVVLGSFFAHAIYSIWGYVFPIHDAPWTGTLGVFSAVLWLALAAFPGVLIGPVERAPEARA